MAKATRAAQMLEKAGVAFTFPKPAQPELVWVMAAVRSQADKQLSYFAGHRHRPRAAL